MNLDKFREDYWNSLDRLNKAQKAQDEDSAKHKGYIDRDHYRYLARKTSEAREIVQSMYNFIKTCLVIDTIELKRGQYYFNYRGLQYEAVKKKAVYKGQSDYWTVEGEGTLKSVGGEYETKEKLVDMTNYYIIQQYVLELIGEKPNK